MDGFSIPLFLILKCPSYDNNCVKYRIVLTVRMLHATYCLFVGQTEKHDFLIESVSLDVKGQL